MHLIAQGKQPFERWRKPLAEQKRMTLGRTAVGWSVPWDSHISGDHVTLELHGDALLVRRLPQARNPVYVDGQQVQECTLGPGQHFVIGSTTFTLSSAGVEVTLNQPQPDQEQQFSADYLRELRYRDAEKRIHVLSQLPEIIGEAPSDTSLLLRLTGALFLGIPPADTVAIVKLVDDQSSAQRSVDVLHWDRKTLTSSEFRPSQRLIEAALDQAASTLHIWQTGDGGGQFTEREDHTWAYCTPVPGAACRGWAIYIAGTNYGDGVEDSDVPPDEPFRDDLKFTETVAATLGNLEALKQLERTQTTFRQFFSAPVLGTLGQRDPEEALAPRLTELSVLFCDLRAFSSRAEESSGDLLALLDQVSSAIAIMTRCILDHGGVIGDFQGDSAMGFWGWPLPDLQRTSRACAAALAIRNEFARQHPDLDRQPALRSDERLAVGIGIASGRGVAGKIGTPDQVKVTVFGPVVNLAARLEGMTRKINVPILIDDTTATEVQQDADLQVRTIANIVPFGMTTVVTVSELLTSDEASTPTKQAQLGQFRDAARWLMDGDWARAATTLRQLKTDGAAAFLLQTIEQHGGVAPPDWDGIIRMHSK